MQEGVNGFLVPPSNPNALAEALRRAFATTSSAPAYGYDSYGVPLQVTAPITDFVFGGMLYNSDSGLYLANFRAYDPVAGRWLSRDSLGEKSGPLGNLYDYVSGNPIGATDPLGLWTLQVGFSVNLQIGAGYGVLGAGIAIDGQGQIGGYWSAGGGTGVGARASGGVQVLSSPGLW